MSITIKARVRITIEEEFVFVSENDSLAALIKEAEKVALTSLGGIRLPIHAQVLTLGSEVAS